MAIVLDGTAGITTPDLTDTSLTSGRVVYAGTSGNLTGSANLGFDGTNLGIGTSSPTRSLTIEKSGAAFPSTSNPSVRFNELSSGRFATIELDSSQNLNIWNGNSTTASTRFYRDSGSGVLSMVIDGSGNLCLGSTEPGNAGSINLSIGVAGATAGGLQLWASSAQEHYIQWGDSTVGSATYAGAISYAHATNFMRFWVNSTERMRIDSAGSLLVGATSNSTYPSRIYAVGTSAYGGLSVAAPGDGSGYPVFFVDTNATSATQQLVHFERNTTYVGSINTTNTATSYSTSSDYRLKNTIAPITGALAKVALLKPCTYKWNADGSASEGFIAHELAEVCPIAVHGTKDAIDADGKPDYQSVDTSFLVATLTAAIQEQQALITTLTERITALEGA